IQSTVRNNVAAGSTLNTDAFQSYTGLVADYMHRVIDHAEAYVDGTVHTNGCENFWSLLKRGLNGTYVSVEPFHLFRYLDEQAFRFNHRQGLTDADRFALAISGMGLSGISCVERVDGVRAVLLHREPMMRVGAVGNRVLCGFPRSGGR